MIISKIESFVEVFGRMDGGNILDVACGEGQFIKVLQTSLRSWGHITGLDVNENILKLASGKFKGRNISFVEGSSQKIPFPDDRFDLVSLSKGLHHVEDPDAALQEMKRVLKPGGYLVINEMYSDGLTESQISQKMFHHLRVELDEILGVSHFYTFKKEEIIKFAEGLNLSDLKIYEYQEDQNDPMNAERIKEHAEKLDSWLVQVADHGKYDYFYKRVNDLKERFRKVGFTRPPQLLVVGGKREA